MIKSTQKFDLDTVGFWASALCAVHCAIVPLLLTFSTLGGFHFLEDPLLENSMLTLAIIVALFSLLPSFLQKHQKAKPLLIAFFGFALIVWGRFTEIDVLEAINTVAGGTLVAVSHLINSNQLKVWNKSTKLSKQEI